MSPAPSRNPKWVWLAAAVVLALGFVAAILWLRPGTTGGPPAEISVAQAVAKRDAGSLVLDVRQPEEWEEYHVPGSTLIPLGELEGRVGEVPRDREVVVVCRSGNRSKRGRDLLLEAGYTDVTSMTGGLETWRAEGHPIATGP